MADTERVVMLWPKELKDKVREVAGKRGITEFTVDAVSIHLGVSGDLGSTNKELNEVKYFAQQLADQLVLGVESPEERLQALMEIEFPSWIDTSGWPPNFAARVHPEPVAIPEPEPDWISDESPLTPEEKVEKFEALEKPDPQPEVEVVATESDREMVAEPSRDDLFARVMAKAGGKLDDVPGLKLASQVEKPAPREEEPVVVDSAPRCATCGEELVDGECWTCM